MTCETIRPNLGNQEMPRTFWTPSRDETLRTNYPVLGPTPTASVLGISRRSVINRAHRLNLKAPYPKDRAKPSFPPKSWSPAECLLAEVLLDYLDLNDPFPLHQSIRLKQPIHRKGIDPSEPTPTRKNPSRPH
jgi:hypothetical protein